MTKVGVLHENARISRRFWRKLISLRSILADYTLNIFVPGHYSLLIRNRSNIMANPRRLIIVTESFQPRVDCEKVTRYRPIYFANFDEYFVSLFNNSDQTSFFNILTFARSLGRGKNPRALPSVFNTPSFGESQCIEKTNH